MVGFDFTLDAEKEISRFQTQRESVIVVLRVKELLEDHEVARRIPPSPARPVRDEYAQPTEREALCESYFDCSMV